MSIKENQLIETKIIDQNNNGEGIAKINGMVVFINETLKEDIVNIKITQIKKNFARGKVVTTIKNSSERTTPPCIYYSECGGCNLQHQDYIHQLKFKEKKIKNALEKIGELKNVNVNSILHGEDYNYRNKVSLKVNGQSIGFYKKISNDIVNVNECIISDKKINNIIRIIRKFINDYNCNNIKEIIIRTSNNNEILLSIHTDKFNLSKEIYNLLNNEINTLIIDNKLIFGNGYITESVLNLKFKVSHSSFFQVNKYMTETLFYTVLKQVENIKNMVVLDLYCGTGTLTLLFAKHAKKAIGIENHNNSIINAKENAKLNKINNVDFILGKVEDKIDSIINKRIDIIVLDPPRKGSDKKTLNAIVKINPLKIIYVSCDPVTLARDLNFLEYKGYKTVNIQPIDMFPNTMHVECVVLLEKK